MLMKNTARNNYAPPSHNFTGKPKKKIESGSQTSRAKIEASQNMRDDTQTLSINGGSSGYMNSMGPKIKLYQSTAG